jgi:hypothetical protein
MIGFGNPLLDGFPGGPTDNAEAAQIAKDRSHWAAEAQAPVVPRDVATGGGAFRRPPRRSAHPVAQRPGGRAVPQKAGANTPARGAGARGRKNSGCANHMVNCRENTYYTVERKVGLLLQSSDSLRMAVVVPWS